MKIALFDFDGTISQSDSFSHFLEFSSKNPIDFFIKKYIKSFPSLVKYKLNLISLGDLKARRVNIFLSEFSKSDLILLSEKFTKTILEKIIYPKALDRINWHKSNNHEIYIVSASFDFCLKLWCEKMKVKLITNEFDFENSKLYMPDCNYEEKVNRIRLAVPNLSKYEEVFAYGDSDGDSAMLEIADNKFFQFFN
jgi:phosphatidylglycerophosphatase C